MASRGAGRFVNTLAGLYVAAAIGVAVSLLLLVTALVNPNGFDYRPAWFVYLSIALAFNGALAIVSSRISRSPSRRRWFVACAAASAVIAIGGGGIGSLILFGPSTAILVWLAITG
jgi:hypothetical protein